MDLFINACVRPQSRTYGLALSALKDKNSTETVNLYDEKVLPIDYKMLCERDGFIEKGDFSSEMFRLARQFATAERIIIAAPYWDLSFPSVLKCYVEAICVNGLTFRYSEKGIPEGLCRARELVYVTTAGGFIPESNFGFDYIDSLCKGLFGIKNTVYIKAEGLDIYGANVEKILNEAKKQLEEKIK